MEFDTEVFDLQVAFRLHPIVVDGNTHAGASAAMFDRAHPDHVALMARSRASFETTRQRLVRRDWE